MSPIALPLVTRDEELSAERIEQAKVEDHCELPLHGKEFDPLDGSRIDWHAEGGPLWLHDRGCACRPRITCDRYRAYLTGEYTNRRSSEGFGICASCGQVFTLDTVSFIPLGD